MLWWGLFTALTTIASPRLTHALLLLILIRFSLGAGEAVIYPASNQFVARWIPVAERGRANGWIFAGVGAGAGLSIPVLAWIIGGYGWRASFWFCAVLGVLVGLAWYVMARDTPEQHPHVSANELKLIQATRSIDGSRRTNPPLSWSAALFNRNVAALTLSYFTFGYVAWIFFSWFFIYMAQARGLNLKSNAFFSMIPFLAMTVCCLSGGLISDWLSKKIRPARRTLRHRGSFVCSHRGLSCYRFARARALSRQLHSRGRRRCFVSLAKFLLGGQRGHLGRAFGSRLRRDEHGLPDRRSCHRFPHALYGRARTAGTPHSSAAAILAAAGGAMWLFVDPGRLQRTKPRAASDGPPAFNPKICPHPLRRIRLILLTGVMSGGRPT